MRDAKPLLFARLVGKTSHVENIGMAVAVEAIMEEQPIDVGEQKLFIRGFVR